MSEDSRGRDKHQQEEERENEASKVSKNIQNENEETLVKIKEALKNSEITIENIKSILQGTTQQNPDRNKDENNEKPRPNNQKSKPNEKN